MFSELLKIRRIMPRISFLTITWKALREGSLNAFLLDLSFVIVWRSLRDRIIEGSGGNERFMSTLQEKLIRHVNLDAVSQTSLYFSLDKSVKFEKLNCHAHKYFFTIRNRSRLSLTKIEPVCAFLSLVIFRLTKPSFTAFKLCNWIFVYIQKDVRTGQESNTSQGHP